MIHPKDYTELTIKTMKMIAEQHGLIVGSMGMRNGRDRWNIYFDPKTNVCIQTIEEMNEFLRIENKEALEKIKKNNKLSRVLKTGLKDKNGRDIKVGDILQWPSYEYITIDETQELINKPIRETIINEDDITNIKITLNTAKTIDELIKELFEFKN